MQEQIDNLIKENTKLKEQLERVDKKNSKKAATKKRLFSFIGTVIAGKKLKNSIYDSLTEFNELNKISIENSSNLLANLIRRLTRIGFIGLLIAILPTTLMFYQNRLLKQQNIKIQDQTYLAEASRRSAQMFIMGDVLSDLNTELDSRGPSTLSNTLTGRIVSLSRAMKPYKYLINDKLINAPISPERGQLLITLCKSNIAPSFFVDQILQESDFTRSELTNTKLIGKTLTDINLNYSNLSGSELRNVNFKRASLKYANLKNTDLEEANFNDADLTEANLTGAYLTDANIKKANLTKVILDSVKVERKDWLSYIRNELKLKGANALFEKYKMDSIYYYKSSRVKKPIILKR